MIYLDACALLKFIKPEKESDALRAGRGSLPEGTELLTSDLARLEITRTLFRAGIDPQRCAVLRRAGRARVYVIDLTTTVLARAAA